MFIALIILTILCFLLLIVITMPKSKINMLINGIISVFKIVFGPKQQTFSLAEILANGGIPKDNISECMAWAFGENWEKTPHILLPAEWRHKDIFEITDNMPVIETLQKIGKAFLEQKIKKNKNSISQQTP